MGQLTWLVFKYKRLSLVFAALTVAYLAQALLGTPDPHAVEKYHITAAQLTALVMTIAIPYIIIWVVALIGYLRLKDYTEAIKNSKDGAALSIITKGILMFALWLPVSAVWSSFMRQYYRANPDATANLVRLDNYINLVILLGPLGN